MIGVAINTNGTVRARAPRVGTMRSSRSPGRNGTWGRFARLHLLWPSFTAERQFSTSRVSVARSAQVARCPVQSCFAPLPLRHRAGTDSTPQSRPMRRQVAKVGVPSLRKPRRRGTRRGDAVVANSGHAGGIDRFAGRGDPLRPWPSSVEDRSAGADCRKHSLRINRVDRVLTGKATDPLPADRGLTSLVPFALSKRSLAASRPSHE